MHTRAYWEGKIQTKEVVEIGRRHPDRLGESKARVSAEAEMQIQIWWVLSRFRGLLFGSDAGHGFGSVSVWCGCGDIILVI